MIATRFREELLALFAAFDAQREAMLAAWKALAAHDGTHTLALAVEIQQTAAAMRAAMPERKS